MSNAKKVLLVEDNENLNQINRRALERAGHLVLTALNLKQAREHLHASIPDVIILDIMLPDGNGVDFCKEIRQCIAAPILFLTSVAGYEQTLEGLAAGGDDYLNKPFDLNLLIAKVSAFLRRDEIVGRIREMLELGSLSLDLFERKAKINDEDIQLAPKEFSILLLFLQNKNKVLAQEMIYTEVWKQPMSDDPNALKVLISRLRKKLEPACLEIIAVRGVGYQLVEQ